MAATHARVQVVKQSVCQKITMVAKTILATYDGNGAQRRFHPSKKHHNTNYFAPGAHFPGLFFDIRTVRAKRTRVLRAGFLNSGHLGCLPAACCTLSE